MSTFLGRMQEYGNISIDRFDGDNLTSTVYLLSHCHSDHMVGLDRQNLLYRLQSDSRIKIYCSAISKELLLADRRYQRLQPHINVLELEEPSTIAIPDEKPTSKVSTVMVTLIPAGHCPGSVMFLFEGEEGTALYTGDFRWEQGTAASVTPLHSSGSVKTIDSLYIDTTFFVPEAVHIASRQECVEATVPLVQDWITVDERYMVHINSRTKLGHEHLLRELATQLDTKVHVSKEKMEKFKNVADICSFFTEDPSETKIHACSWVAHDTSSSRLPCGYVMPSGEAPAVRVITPSTMWFTQRPNLESIVQCTKTRHRVCYSFHSSYSEVRDLVMYLKPKEVYPNVKPMGYTLEQTKDRLMALLQTLGEGDSQHVPSYRPLGMLRQNRRRRVPSLMDDSESMIFDDDDEDDGGHLHRAKQPRMETADDEMIVEASGDGSHVTDSQRSSNYNTSVSSQHSAELFSSPEIHSSQCSTQPVYVSDVSDDEEEEEKDDDADDDDTGDESQKGGISCTDNREKSPEMKNEENPENEKQQCNNEKENEVGAPEDANHANGKQVCQNDAKSLKAVVSDDAEMVGVSGDRSRGSPEELANEAMQERKIGNLEVGSNVGIAKDSPVKSIVGKADSSEVSHSLESSDHDCGKLQGEKGCDLVSSTITVAGKRSSESNINGKNNRHLDTGNGSSAGLSAETGSQDNGKEKDNRHIVAEDGSLDNSTSKNNSNNNGVKKDNSHASENTTPESSTSKTCSKDKGSESDNRYIVPGEGSEDSSPLGSCKKDNGSIVSLDNMKEGDISHDETSNFTKLKSGRISTQGLHKGEIICHNVSDSEKIKGDDSLMKVTSSKPRLCSLLTSSTHRHIYRGSNKAGQATTSTRPFGEEEEPSHVIVLDDDDDEDDEDVGDDYSDLDEMEQAEVRKLVGAYSGNSHHAPIDLTVSDDDDEEEDGELGEYYEYDGEEDLFSDEEEGEIYLDTEITELCEEVSTTQCKPCVHAKPPTPQSYNSHPQDLSEDDDDDDDDIIFVSHTSSEKATSTHLVDDGFQMPNCIGSPSFSDLPCGTGKSPDRSSRKGNNDAACVPVDFDKVRTASCTTSGRCLDEVIDLLDDKTKSKSTGKLNDSQDSDLTAEPSSGSASLNLSQTSQSSNKAKQGVESTTSMPTDDNMLLDATDNLDPSGPPNSSPTLGKLETVSFTGSNKAKQGAESTTSMPTDDNMLLDATDILDPSGPLNSSPTLSKLETVSFSASSPNTKVSANKGEPGDPNNGPLSPVVTSCDAVDFEVSATPGTKQPDEKEITELQVELANGSSLPLSNSVRSLDFDL